ncbi:MAG: J domain-containing protein [Desulfobacteraceae bacterium]|nr:MAG: J domain-containing protein [Desulfobacteraceae bacterium]
MHTSSAARALIKEGSGNRTRKCLSCGKDLVRPQRKYCGPECRDGMSWVLSLSNGLLRTFNARYAAFSFTSCHVILDVLPAWSKLVSRFSSERVNGNTPAEDLKNLVLDWGRAWHGLVENHTSRSRASLKILEENLAEGIRPDTLRPVSKQRPRLSREQREYLRILGVDAKDLERPSCGIRINSAFRRMAKLHHPDIGGDEEKFKLINEAHKQMLYWSENPQFTSKRALQDCWSYDGATNRWRPPL